MNRRDFLKATSISTGVIASFPTVPTEGITEHASKLSADQASFTDHWTRLFSNRKTDFVDVVGSVTEKTLNEVLKKHFELDKEKYTVPYRRKFDANGKAREFSGHLKLTVPLSLYLKPFNNNPRPRVLNGVPGADWAEVSHPGVEDDTLAPKPEETALVSTKFDLLLEWEKLDGSGKWTLEVPGIEAHARAFAEIDTTQSRPQLRVTPTRIYFDKADQSFASTLVREWEALIPDAAKAEGEEKFRDLVVILLNILATELTPKLVREIALPAPVLAGEDIFVNFLDVSGNMITVGGGLDYKATREAFQSEFEERLTTFQTLFAMDIAAQLSDAGQGPATVNSLSENELELTESFFAGLEEAAEKLSNIHSRDSDSAVLSAGAITGGVGIGVAEYVFDRLAAAKLPEAKRDCSGWERILRHLKGRLCWWMSFYAPDVHISPTGSGFRLTGSIGVDVGGTVEACIKKFWDCSWRWVCPPGVGLQTEGNAGLGVSVTDYNKGVIFRIGITDLPRLKTVGIPSPFNKVIDFFLKIVHVAFRKLATLVTLSRRLIAPRIVFDSQRTGLQLRNFKPFYYVRPYDNLDEPGRSRARYAAFSIDAKPIGVDV